MILSHTMPRPKKILTLEEQKKKDNRLRVRFIILRLLSHINPRDISWIVETGIVKLWVKKYGFEFVEKFDLPNFLSETDSLRPLTGDWGKGFLDKSYNLWLFKKRQNENLLPEVNLTEKIGEDYKKTGKKPNNLVDFLKR
jgi:hypothetical protein